MKFDLQQVVTVDFETFYDTDYSLRSKELNTSEYVRDPRFIAHCCSIKEGTGETHVYWYDDIRPALEEAFGKGPRHMLAHNTAFDGLIASEHYDIVPPSPWPRTKLMESEGEFPICLYLDTLSMGRGLLHGYTQMNLDALMAYYGRPGKNPNILGKMKGHRVIPEEIREEAEIYCKGDTDKCFWLFERWIASYPEAEIYLIDWTIRQFCDPVLRVDVPRAAAALEREQEKKRVLIADAELTSDDPEKELQSAEKFAAKLREYGVEPPTKISKRTKLETYAFSLQDDEFMELILHEDERVQKLMRARLAAKSTIGESRAQRFVNVGLKPLCVALNYAAAHTLRWGGANKMNLQNLETKEYDEVTGELIPFTGELRECILAPEGHVIVVCDSGQIEARINAWVAGQDDLLELFRSGGDPYIALACEIYGGVVTKADRDKRAVGKAGVLGLGFYMGAKRFQASLAAGILGPKIHMDLADCQRIVDIYRQKNHRIRALWKELETVIRSMWKKSHMLHETATTTLRPDVLEFDHDTVWLPNGLGLHYPDLACTEDSDGSAWYTYRSGREFPHIHAGVLTENIVQALARVVIGEQLLRINKRYRVVMMTHDEIVCIAPVNEAQECLDFMLKEMATPPAWAPDLPLKAEGGYDVCYSK